MPFPLYISQDAQADLTESYLYYESQRPGLGDAFVTELELSFNQIEDNPLLFPLVFDKKRRAVLHKFKHNIFFIFNGKEVQILAVMHGSRDIKRWQNG